MDVSIIQRKILAAKEETYTLKCQTIEKYGNSLVSLALNVPGWPKSNKLLRRFFFEVLDEFKIFALAQRLLIVGKTEKIIDNDNGLVYFGIFTFPHSANEAKRITEKFENRHKLGRFIDIDIVDNKCNIITSGKEKACFICKSQSAISCMREKRHDIDELVYFQHYNTLEYLSKKHKNKQAETLSELLLNSLLAEISLFPKPGLVSPIDSGSHTDMDYATFLRSTSALSTIFHELFNQTILSKKNYTFEELRELGIVAELKMTTATGNRNTHKGAIFILLIIGYSIAKLVRNGNNLSEENIRFEIAAYNDAILSDPLNKEDNTHGSTVRNLLQNDQIGIRAEIMRGLPSLFDAGLPVFYTEHFSLQKNTDQNNKTLIKSLLNIMCVLNDSNILYRGNEHKLKLVKTKSKEALKALSNNNWDLYKQFCSWMKQENLSPGGAADILVGSLFIYLCQINPKLKPYEL